MADQYTGTSINVSLGTGAKVETHAKGDYAAVTVDDYTGNGWQTISIALPREAGARAIVATQIARAFDELARAAADAMLAPAPEPAAAIAGLTPDLGDHFVREAVA